MEGRGEGLKICIWNIAGVLNKDKETWEYLGNYDIIGLVETWLEKDKWEKIKGKLPKKFNWKCVYAERDSKMGRAKGGILIGVSKKIIESGYIEWKNNIVEQKVKYNEKNWRFVIVYSQNIKDTLETIKREIKEENEEILILGGDWNARTGEEGGLIVEGIGNEDVRISKDKLINKEGKILINELEERGWCIINGSKEEEGEYTYVGKRGSSVIDYIIGNQEAIEYIRKMKIGHRTESDHLPLELEIEGEEIEKEKIIEKDNIEKRDWSEEGIKAYHENCKDWEIKEETVERIWTEIKNKVQEAIPKIEMKRKKWELGEKVWHDKEWKLKKRELRRELRKWKKGKIKREEYLQRKKEYKSWCTEKRKEYERNEEEKIKKIKKEQEVWKYINKYRKRREQIEDEIEMEEWRSHFKIRFGGKECREILSDTEDEEEENDKKEEGISKDEVILQIRKLKIGKAPGEDMLENEVWKNMPNSVGRSFWTMLDKIWKEGGIPEEWKIGIISPIYKKGEKNIVKNYRGVTLMDTAYKVYAGILNARLMKEVDKKLEEAQFGFRKGRGVTDAVYVLSHLVDRQLGEKGGKVFACFADLTEAFDRVDRKLLRKELKKIGVSDKLRKRIMETYKETINKVKIRNNYSREFWTTRGVRQGCPLSPTLFNIYLKDFEEEMRKEQTGGVEIGKKHVWSITYADDIVLLAKSEEELRSMLRRFKKYLEKKKMILSAEKTKILVFENGNGKKKSREWNWGDEKLEEVKEIRYLGYILQKNGGVEKQMRERKRKAVIAMKSTWSIGERIFRNNFDRRMKMFTSLVESVGLFGAEIWGWKKDERLDAITRKYIKWTLGLDMTTPNYILIEETKVEEMKVKALRRAVRFEDNARKSEKELVKECIKERERGERRGGGKENGQS